MQQSRRLRRKLPDRHHIQKMVTPRTCISTVTFKRGSCPPCIDLFPTVDAIHIRAFLLSPFVHSASCSCRATGRFGVILIFGRQ